MVSAALFLFANGHKTLYTSPTASGPGSGRWKSPYARCLLQLFDATTAHPAGDQRGAKDGFAGSGILLSLHVLVNLGEVAVWINNILRSWPGLVDPNTGKAFEQRDIPRHCFPPVHIRS